MEERGWHYADLPMMQANRQELSICWKQKWTGYAGIQTVT